MKIILAILLLTSAAWGQTNPVPEAKPTDGVTPIYSIEPVTQKVPHCAPGFKLMRFDPSTEISLGYNDIMPDYHPDRWTDVAAPNINMTFTGYRCFPDPKAKPAAIPSDTPQCKPNGDLDCKKLMQGKTHKESQRLLIPAEQISNAHVQILDLRGVVATCKSGIPQSDTVTDCVLENGRKLTDVVNAWLQAIKTQKK